ncbi:glycosyltransferase family 2 protein [Tamlana sp. s12]|uniref:glycosyltransferase family 2 protein n=1 Tax=Tamlana sp. s12 TaxID=1630406 RepID=UPI0008385322|nr:glycosyltransferase family 2 protein [Tamlana sp. s12]QQY80919.1 glycosyltransferase family 2 protein [Tamlana sp. s12]
MLNTSLVSIIIPTYDSAATLIETLKSVSNQSYQNWECIIVDDGSIDSTRELVRNAVIVDERFQLYERPKVLKKGANSCRNFGLTKSKGGYLMFLDSDDLITINCLENRLQEFVRDKSLDFVITNTSYYKNNKKSSVAICEFPEQTVSSIYLHEFLSNELPWTIMDVLWKREAIESVKFDECLARFQDDDFHIRVLLNKDLKCYRINIIDSYYRVEDEQVSLSDKYIDEALKDYYKILIKYEHLNLVLNYNTCLKRFNCKVILEFILPFFELNKRRSNKILKYNLKSKLYTLNQKLYIGFLILLLNLELFNIKGIGINTFRRQLKKVILK